MLTLGARFAAERNRLDLTPDQVGGLLRVTAGTVRSWELGKSLMSVAQLVSFAKVGADAMFIATGDRTVPGAHAIDHAAALARGLMIEALRQRLRRFDAADRRAVLAALMMDEQP